MKRLLKTLIAAATLVLPAMFAGQVLAQDVTFTQSAETAPAQVARLDLILPGTLQGGDYGV